MKRQIDENRKVTLTLGQLKKLINESEDNDKSLKNISEKLMHLCALMVTVKKSLDDVKNQSIEDKNFRKADDFDEMVRAFDNIYNEITEVILKYGAKYDF